MTFKQFRDLQLLQLKKVLACDQLYSTNFEAYPVYLRAFVGDEVQVHTCSTCQSWLRNMGNVIGILNGQRVTMWDFDAEGIYKPVVKALQAAAMESSVTGPFVPVQRTFGALQNKQLLDDGSVIIWHHFHTRLPNQHLISPGRAAELVSAYSVLQRSCTELKPEAFITVQGLINDNNLLRGKQFEKLVDGLEDLVIKYLEAGNTELFLWENCTSQFAKVRNTAIGSLLVELSEGKGLVESVGRYEAMVGGENYKRKKALITPAQRERFKEAVEGYGLTRRYATEGDLPTGNVQYLHRVEEKAKDVFDLMDNTIVVDQRKINAQEVSIDEFMELLGDLTDVKMLALPNHLNKFAALMTGEEPSLVAWGNPFTISYTGGTADSIKERVAKAGGNVDAKLRVSLAWANSDDLDLHAHCPDGHVYYSQKKGILDVDMNVHATGPEFNDTDPVENLSWTRPKVGEYKIQVHQYKRRNMPDKGFTVQVAFDGQVWEYHHPTSPKGTMWETVVQFKITSAGIVINGQLGSIRPVEKWGVSTQRWLPVHNVFLSPNFWNGNSGNKHYFFHSREIVSDEMLIGLFNEQVIPAIHQHHGNAVELMGELVRCQPIDNPVCGIALSETQNMGLYIRAMRDGKVQHYIITKS